MARSSDSFCQWQAEALRERILWLEEELASSRRSLRSLHLSDGEAESGREEWLLSGRGEDGEPGGGVDAGREEVCFLAPLLPHEEVIVRWRLGEGLQAPRPQSGRGGARSSSVASRERGESLLRLFGLLPSGQPWKCSIPFADLARSGGVLLGRSPEEADIVLNEDSVSRRHARLELDNQGLVITDEDSLNGVFVNGCRLSPYERRVALADGMTVSIGEVALRVEIVLSPSTPPT